MKRVNKEKDMVKSRLVVLEKMFYTQTDEEHQMINTEILEYLKEHDVPANEKTLRGDIRLLQQLGVSIVKVVSRPNRYYLGEREFEMPDRLVDPVITDERAEKKPEDFDIDDYSRRIFEMYDGEPTLVKLECKNDFAKYIVDRFGTNLETKQTSDDYFQVEVEVSLSPTFYAWVFRFGGEIRILSPVKAVNEITEMAKKLVDRETI